MRDGLTQEASHQEGQPAAQDDEEDSRSQRRAPASDDAGHHHRGGGRHRDERGLKEQSKLLDARVELTLKHRQPDEQPPAGQDDLKALTHRGQPLRRRWGLLRIIIRQSAVLPTRRHHGRAPLDDQTQDADHREPGTTDEHEMGGPPQGDVLPEQPVPDVIEGKADERKRAAGHKQDAAHRDMPVARQTHGGATGAPVGEHQGQPSGGEQAEQSGEDEVVGGIGQRARVAPVVDVQGDVPVHAEHRRDQCHRGQDQRQGGPAR